MKLIEVFGKYEISNTVCVVVRTEHGLRALTDNNFLGGCCGCCQGCPSDDNLVVERVVDMATMEVFYQAKQ